MTVARRAKAALSSRARQLRATVESYAHAWERTLVTDARIPDGRTLTVLARSVADVSLVARFGDLLIDPFRTRTWEDPRDGRRVQASFLLPSTAQTGTLCEVSVAEPGQSAPLPAVKQSVVSDATLRDADYDDLGRRWLRQPDQASWRLSPPADLALVPTDRVDVNPTRFEVGLGAADSAPVSMQLEQPRLGVRLSATVSSHDGCRVGHIAVSDILRPLEGCSGTVLLDVWAHSTDAVPRGIGWLSRDVNNPRAVVRLAGCYSTTDAVLAWLRPYWTAAGRLRLKVELFSPPR